nr:enoyl-CoA hydratase/isomerase family protein [Amylibacter sp.]
MSDWFTTTDMGGGVARLMLHRAPVNALNPAFLDALGVEYDRLGADSSVRAVVLGSDLKVLSGGLDLKEAQGFDLQGQWDIVRALNESFTKLYALPKPTIAAINGAAIAGGFFFVIGCDYRVTHARANFGLAEVRVGATLPFGPLELARAELSAADMRRLLLNGQPIRAEAALASGIVDEIVAADTVMDRALDLAAQYAALPPKTYAASKADLRGTTVQRIETAMQNGANTPKGGWFSDETKTAMAAMLAG